MHQGSGENGGDHGPDQKDRDELGKLHPESGSQHRISGLRHEDDLTDREQYDEEYRGLSDSGAHGDRRKAHLDKAEQDGRRGLCRVRNSEKREEGRNRLPQPLKNRGQMDEGECHNDNGDHISDDFLREFQGAEHTGEESLPIKFL